ncbi:MAG: GH3 auxin-responsive promoter family protein [Parasporobacterium sp.]|nr:GH3 auxin-responsive promoter family protein [Parasporobacterium sp.]
MMRGEKNVLTAYPISFYAHTSGTIGASKHIPFTERAAEIVRAYRSISEEAYAEYTLGKPPCMPSAPKNALSCHRTGGPCAGRNPDHKF